MTTLHISRRFARENFTSGRCRRLISSSMLKVPIEIVHVLTGTCFPALHLQRRIEKLIVVVVYICPFFNSKAQKSPLVFEDPDIQIVEAAKKKDKGVAVGFVVLYTDGKNTQVMPKSFVHKFVTSELNENGKMAGYQVIMVDGKGTSEGKPGGQHSDDNKSSKKTYIYIIVGVVFGLIFVLALIFVVKRLVCHKALKLQGADP